MVIWNNDGGRYARNFVQNSPGPVMDPEFTRIYQGFAKRILWMDGDVVPGAFQMNTCWWYKANREQTLANPNSPVA